MLAGLLFCFALPFRLNCITCIDTRLGALDCWFWIDHGAKKDRPAPARKERKRERDGYMSFLYSFSLCTRRAMWDARSACSRAFKREACVDPTVAINPLFATSMLHNGAQERQCMIRGSSASSASITTSLPSVLSTAPGSMPSPGNGSVSARTL